MSPWPGRPAACITVLAVLAGGALLGVAPTASASSSSSAVGPSRAPGAGVVPPSRLAARAGAGRAGAAADGSIVYIRDHDVYLARPDGSDERRLTRDGTADDPWSSPSEDDAGHVVAVHGTGNTTQLVRMDQSGRALATFDPPVRSLAVGFARVSLDGSRIAYGSLFGETDCGYTPCHTFFDHAVNYTKATTSAEVSTAQEDAGFATWASDGRTILETTVHNEVRYHDVASATSAVWFDDCLDYDEGCNDTNLLHYMPTVARQGDRYASVLEVSPWSGSPEE